MQIVKNLLSCLTPRVARHRATHKRCRILPNSEIPSPTSSEGSNIPLKEDKDWDAWDRNTIAQAQAQDVSEVLDSLYIAKTDEDKALFDEKQKYLFAVFEKNILTDQGKAIVRDHAYRYDARQVYIELKAYSLESTKASIE